MSRNDYGKKDQSELQRRRIGSTVDDILRNDEDFETAEQGPEIIDLAGTRSRDRQSAVRRHADGYRRKSDIGTDYETENDIGIRIGFDDSSGAGENEEIDYTGLCENGTENEELDYTGLYGGQDDEEIEEERRRIHEDLRSGRLIHRDIRMVTVMFVLLFAGIIAYLIYMYNVRSDEYLASPYNTTRQSIYRDRFIRGDIVSSDGELLATTRVAADGTEERDYIYGSRYAHIVGYSTKGTTGIEKAANSYLLGSHISPITRALNELRGEKTRGDTVITTVDSRLQEAAWEALGERQGAVTVMDVRTGAILAMVSKPDFDPNEIREIWDELTGDPGRSDLVNRATQGLYPPGSTFKVLTLLEYMRENPDTYGSFSFDCDGSYEAGEYVINCSKGIAHGGIGLREAFARSCNGAFASLGSQLDINRLNALCGDFGYNSKLPIALENNASSFTLENGAGVFDVLQTSIGQGRTLTTPLQNLMVAAAVANGGVVMTPQIISGIRTSEGGSVWCMESEAYRTLMTPDEARTIASYMRSVVTDGTGTAADGDGYSVAGKTGSAQWSSGAETHAWFIGFAPYDDPKIAISVIIENSGSGGSVAAPVAKAVFDRYFAG